MVAERYAWILEPKMRLKFDRSHSPAAKHEPSSICWPWTGPKGRKGYGRLVLRGPERKEISAHRAAWLLEHGGDILPEQVVAHICRTPGCVNPQHLEVTTRKGVSDVVHTNHRGSNQRKTHCIRGHPLEGANLLTRGKRRGRKCRICELARPSRKEAKRRELAKRRAATAARRAARAQQIAS